MKTPASEREAVAARLSALEQTSLLDASPDEAFDRLTRLATEILQAPISLVSLVEETRQYFKSCVGLPEPWATQRETPLTHSFCQHVVADAAPLIISDATQHPLVRDNLAIRDLGVVAYLGIPLTTSTGIVLGSFCVIDTHPRAWTKKEIALLTELAAWAMTEIELRRQVRLREKAEEILREMSMMDDLTGLYNRRAMGFFLEEEAARSRRFSSPLGMVMLDLDRFKEINDHYGHKAGDEMLCRAADIIQQSVRTIDHAIRYGGDEFLLLLPDTDKTGATALAERLRAAYELDALQAYGASNPMTLSAGEVSMPEDAATVEDLLSKADKALYEAKRQGRNQTA